MHLDLVALRLLVVALRTCTLCHTLTLFLSQERLATDHGSDGQCMEQLHQRQEEPSSHVPSAALSSSSPLVYDVSLLLAGFGAGVFVSLLMWKRFARA